MSGEFIYVLLGGPSDGLEGRSPMPAEGVPGTITRSGGEYQSKHVYVLLGLAGLQPTEGDAPRVEYTYSGPEHR